MNVDFRLEELDGRMTWFLATIMYQYPTRTADPISSPQILGHGCFDQIRLHSDHARQWPIWHRIRCPQMHLKEGMVQKREKIKIG